MTPHGMVAHGQAADDALHTGTIARGQAGGRIIPAATDRAQIAEGGCRHDGSDRGHSERHGGTFCAPDTNDETAGGAIGVDGLEQGCSPHSSEGIDRGATDTEFSFFRDEENREGLFQTLREFHCYGYLFGKSRLSSSQYDMMRQVENTVTGPEKWPSRWRLGQIRKALVQRAATVQVATVQRCLPVGKGKKPRKLPDAQVQYILFSEHIKRDFADPATAALFHNKGDSDWGSIDTPTEFHQTVVARDPSRFNFCHGFRLNGSLYDMGCTAAMRWSSTVLLKSTLQETGIADVAQPRSHEPEEGSIPPLPFKERAPYRITRSGKKGRQRYKTKGTVYLPATTVPPTVVALRPNMGGNRRAGPIPLMGIGPHR